MMSSSLRERWWAPMVDLTSYFTGWTLFLNNLTKETTAKHASITRKNVKAKNARIRKLIIMAANNPILILRGIFFPGYR